MSDSDERYGAIGDPETQQPKEPRPTGASFKRLVLRSSAWTFVGHGAGQVLRFGGNLVLTRLLFPEAFGLMALVNVFLQGLAMFSDVGLNASVVQNPRGEEPEFLRTAWTVQILRGLALACAATMLAWPVATFYKEPRLMAFVPIAGAGMFIDGLKSTGLFALERRLDIRTLTILELATQVIGLTVMIVGAYLWRSVWPLVIGQLVRISVMVVLSHTVVKGPRMRPTLNREVAGQLIHFGKWIFLSTVLAFIVGRADRIVLGKFMTMSELGVYSIALSLSLMMVEVVGALYRKVLFPVYAHFAREKPERLRNRTLRVRAALMAVTLPPTWLLIIWGPELIDFLYDTRYHDAGWMLQILGVGAVFATILVPIDSVLLAVGNSFRHMMSQLARSVIMLTGMLIGGYYYGKMGVLVAYVLSSFLYYPFLAELVRGYRVWLPALDLAGVAVSGLVVGLGLWIKG